MSSFISPKTVVKDFWSGLKRVEESRSLLISIAGKPAFGDQGRAARQKLKSENIIFRISLKMVRNWNERRDFMRLGKGNQTKSVDS